jgi:tetratricopeptide (TPR) repeat protein
MIAIEDHPPRPADEALRHPRQQAAGTQHSDDLGPLDAVGGLLLVAALVLAVFLAFDNSEVQARFLARQGEELLEQGRYSEAATHYERTLTEHDTPRVRLGLSYAYLARRDTERAERQARILTGSAPPDFQSAAWAQLGRVLAFKGERGQALEAWTRARERAEPYGHLAPVEAQARSAVWHSAMLHWRTRDYQAARRELEALAGDDIYAISALVKLAQLLAPTEEDISLKLLRSLEDSLRDGSAQRSVASRHGAAVPNLVVPGLREGLTFQEIERTVSELRRAHEDAMRAEAEGTGEAGMDALWGRAYLQQEEPGLAVEYLKRTVAAQPNLADAHSYLAIALLDTGRPEEAKTHLDIAIRLDAERPLPRYVLARLYMQQRDWDRASSELSTLKRLEPTSVQVHLQIAEYYRLRGAYELAEDEYIEAVNLQRDVEEAPEELDAWLALATFYATVSGFDCERGIDAARGSVARRPDNPAALDALGWSLLLCSQPQESLSSLENAVRLAPENARYVYHLGRAYVTLGRYEDARSRFRRTIDLDPNGEWEQRAIRELSLIP